jgi:cytochrome c-type biogenesis protein CcmF
MADIGYIALWIAFGLCLYVPMVSVLGARTRRNYLILSAERGIQAVFGVLTLASFCLIYSLITDNFQLRYVAEHSNRAMPLFYKITAWWGGQEGSLLFWVWILSVFSVIVVAQNRYKNRELMPYVYSTLMSTALFFLVLILFAANPFAVLPPSRVPADGAGLNPLLQNPYMIIHPPNLYLGYVGFTVPFAFAIAALITGRLDSTWIKSTRRWTIFPWYFLGVGILLGAHWAYLELGWGGYWAWDPVENASLMPWLTGTAFLHSVMIQEKKDMLKVWNVSLIILTFMLSIFGTFLTRSGVVSSVHAFAQSSLGYYFLVFLTLVLVFSVFWIVKRWDLLKSRNELDSLISRESIFLLNNLIFVGIAFTVLWGTMFPTLSEAIQGTRITVGPPFFNQVNVPIGLLMLLLTGIGPLIPWRKASWQHLKRSFTYPTLGALMGGIILFLSGVHHLKALLAFVIAMFVAGTILLEYVRGTLARREMTGEDYLTAFFTLISKNRRRYGGYIVHLGIVLIFVGIAGSSAFQIEKEVVMKPGESAIIGDYRIKYQGISFKSDPNKTVASADLLVYRQGEKISGLVPEKHRYLRGDQMVTTEVAIYSTLKEDLYTVLGAIEEDNTAVFKFVINPMVLWIWVGGFLFMTLGTFVITLPTLEELKERERAMQPEWITGKKVWSRA